MVRPSKRSFGSLRLAHQMTALGVLTATTALALVCIVFVGYDLLTSRQAVVRDMQLLAEVVGQHGSAAVAFGDEKETRESLRAVALHDDTLAAAILSPSGAVLARYEREPGAARGILDTSTTAIRAGGRWHQWADGRLRLVHPIVLDKEVLGAVAIIADRSESWSRLRHLGTLTALVFCAAVLVSVAVAFRLQRVISAPIVRLTESARQVTREKHFDVRAQATAGGEVGELIAGFNEMLGEIQARDRTLLRNQEQLEATVAERTADLVEARDRALEASRAKSEFLANMSHEIRTPMNGITGMTELALQQDLPADARECLNTVKTSAASLLGILNDILDFSKIESRKLELEAMPFSLATMLSDMLKPFALTADRRGLELMLDVAPDVPAGVVGDRGRLQQVLGNLLGNALKFTESGHVMLSVRQEERAGHRAVLHFTVSDTGIGIPKEKHETVFEAFSQADGSTTRRFGGTGLGLTISATLTQMMGGRIWLESELGVGTTFHIVVPFELATLADEEPETAVLNGIRVLVVDDNPVNRTILERQLTTWGMRPAAMSDGAAAVEALLAATAAGEPYRLILLDANMPGLDGFGVAARIAAQPALAAATIMMLTSSGHYGDSARCRALGVAAYLTKPIEGSELRLQICRVLQGQPQPGASAAPAPAAPSGGRPARVLLAEDNLVNQRVAVGLLRRYGHHVSIANDGAQALELFSREPFDLVLMDVQMPGMGGFEATALMRERERARGTYTRIVAMTAHAMAGDRERCLAAGMDGYITKPFNPETLFATVAEATRGDLPLPAGVLDEQEMMQRLGGDVALAADVVRVFLDDCPHRLAAIQDAVELQDGEMIRTSAHALKGAAGMIAAPGVYAAAQALEAIGASGNLAEAHAAFRALAAEATQLTAALRRLHPPPEVAA